MSGKSPTITIVRRWNFAGGLLAGLPLACLGASLSFGQQGPKEIRLAEVALRKIVIKAVVPAFPAQSQSRGDVGVAVAQILVDRGGEVKDVHVLQAPDAEIKDAVASALKQWKFQPTTVGGNPVEVQGKLTFYYALDHGKGVVRTPQEEAASQQR